MVRQWDDWRCYRCGVWQPQASARLMVLTPSGMPVAMCPGCRFQGHDVAEHAFGGECEMCDLPIAEARLESTPKPRRRR